MTAPFVASGPISSSACSAACFAAQIRFTWPGPMPTDCLSFARAMPLDFTYLTTFQANMRSSISFSVGFRSVTTWTSSPISLLSIPWTIRPPFTFFMSSACARWGTVMSGIRSTRTFFFSQRMSSASFS